MSSVGRCNSNTIFKPENRHRRALGVAGKFNGISISKHQLFQKGGLAPQVFCKGRKKWRWINNSRCQRQEGCLKKKHSLYLLHWCFHVPRPSLCCAKTGLQDGFDPVATKAHPPQLVHHKKQHRSLKGHCNAQCCRWGGWSGRNKCVLASSVSEPSFFIPVSLSTNSTRASKDRTQETEPGIKQISYVTLGDQKATSVGWGKQLEGWTEDAGWKS